MPQTGFTIIRVEPKYSQSRVLGRGPEPREPIPTGYTAVHAKCNRCGHSWRAAGSRDLEPGYFLRGAGHMTIVCPECEQDNDRQSAAQIGASARAPNCPHKLTNRRSVGPAAEPPRAARNCTAAWRAHIARSELFVSRGARPAAPGQARGAACSLE
jgi:hypothetical protein